MSDALPNPLAPPPATPDERTLAYNGLQALVAVLGLCGVALPLALTSQDLLWQVAGSLVTLAGVVSTFWSLWSHRQKNQTILTTKAMLHTTRARLTKMESHREP